MADTLKGKVALVTGASSGIGEATAHAMAAQGACVAASARRADRLDAVVKRIQDSGGQAISIVADIADEAQANDMVNRTVGRWGRLDILVNNAGVMLLGKIANANTEDWRRMININILGLMYTTRAALTVMLGQKSGHIVNISSVAGRTARAGSGAYNVTKWGVVAFSEALRQEVLVDNIRVTVIEPGAVATELQSNITDPAARRETEEWIRSITPLQGEDIANAIVYAVTQPQRVDINEILIRPSQQAR
jgi:NADP-dependent 3-hydroxy acid dehydrogenase YdfG